MGQRSRRVALGAAAWVGAVVLTGTVAWNAVGVISDDGARTGVLAPHQVSAALAAARASASAAASGSPSGSPSASATPSPDASGPSPSDDPSGTPGAGPSGPGDDPTGAPTSTPGPTGTPTTPPATTPPAPAPAQATWVVTGGSVTAQCTGATIRLLAATPDDGWTVEVGSPGPEHVEVELHRSGSESRVRAACQDGTPVQVGGDSHADDD